MYKMKIFYYFTLTSKKRKCLKYFEEDKDTVEDRTAVVMIYGLVQLLK
jgi:hypothetical protein